MKLFLLTCLVALTLAAPSERTKRGILSGDPRYDSVHNDYHKVHEHHENKVEIARALSKHSGCLSPLGLAKGYGVQESEQETPPDSTNLLAHDARAAVKSIIKSYGSETLGVNKTGEQPGSISESSLTLSNQEPVSSIKSVSVPVTNAVAFIETVDVAAQIQGTAAAAKLPKSEDKDSILEEGTHFEDKSTNEAQEASLGAFAQKPELVKSDNKGSPLEEGTKLEAESVNEAQEAFVAQRPELVKSDNEAFSLEEGTKLEAESANEAQEVSSGDFAQRPELVKPDDKDSPLENGIKIEAKPAIETQEASSGAFAQNLELVKSDDKDPLLEEGTKAATESATGAQEASVNFVQNPQSVMPNIENSDYRDETTHEAESAIHAEHHTNVQEVSSRNFKSNTGLAESHVSDSQPDQSHDIASHPQSDGEAYTVSSDTSQSAIVIPANDAESPVEAPSSDADAATGSSATPFESSFRSSSGPAFNFGFGSANSPALSSTPLGAPSGDANPATGSSATPFGSKFGPPFGSTFNSDFSHSFPPSSISAPPSYNTGYNTYDHSRNNPNIRPGYGYTPGFGGFNANYGQYNNNYGRLGYNGANYYPGHPFGVGIYSGYDQGLNGKTIVNPQVPIGFPHPYPVDYTKNVAYAQPPSFQFRTGYSTPQSVPSFPSIQQTKEQSFDVEASQLQEQPTRSYQSPDSLVQPTAASFQK